MAEPARSGRGKGRVRSGLFEIDLSSGELFKSGRKVALQEQPFLVLSILVEHPGEVVTRQELQTRLWPSDTYVGFDDGLNNAIRKLRLAFGDSADNPRFIETVPRRGYRFIAPVTREERAAAVLRPQDISSVKRAEVDVASGKGELQLPLTRKELPRDESSWVEAAPASDSCMTPQSELASLSQIPAPAVSVVPSGGISTPIDAPPIPATSRTGLLRIAVSLALLIAAAGLAVLFGRPTLPSPRVTGSTQLTNDGRAKETMVTDGAKVYFSYSGYGNSIYQVSTAGGDTVPVETRIPVSKVVDISPDRSKFLVASCAALYENECTLWIVPVLGSSPRRVGEIHAFLRADRDGRGRNPDAAWSPDGKEVVYVQGHSLYRAKIDGTGSRKIISVAEDDIPYWPRWSPDGSRLRFSVQTENNETSLWEVTANGENIHRLLSGWNTPSFECCGSWTPDGNYFLFQSKRGGVTNVCVIREKTDLFRRATHEPVQLTTGPASAYDPLPSPDGKKLFVVTTQVRGELMRYDSASRQLMPYLSGISAMGVNFSVDGKWVTYVAYPEGTLWRSKIDGSERLQLTFPPLYVVQPRWSPDGTRIAFMGQEFGKPWRVYVIPGDGGRPEQPVLGDHPGLDPNWSTDGNTLLFGRSPNDSPLESSTLDLEIVDLRTHAISRVPGSQELWSPRWSRDGRYILALPRDGHGLMVFDIKAQKWTELAKIGVGYPEWSRKGDYIYFLGIPPAGQPRGLFRIRLRDGKLEQVVSLKDFRQAPGWGDWSGLAPDDSPLLVRDAGGQDIYALDWDAP